MEEAIIAEVVDAGVLPVGHLLRGLPKLMLHFLKEHNHVVVQLQNWIVELLRWHYHEAADILIVRCSVWECLHIEAFGDFRLDKSILPFKGLGANLIGYR